MQEQLQTDYQTYIHKSRYARWLDSKGRRENWEETVDRYIDFFAKRIEDLVPRGFTKLQDQLIEECGGAIIGLEVMPSMRALMTAGVALKRDHVAGYNCAYLAIDGNRETIQIEVPELNDVVELGVTRPVDFDEVAYILLCGTGVGFSVERQFIDNLPKIGRKLSRNIYARTEKNFPGVPKEELSTYDRARKTIHVADSKYGWASAIRILIVELYNGNFEVEWDTSKIRPAGSPLKTFGGRASGPEPIISLFRFTKEIFQRAFGRKLNSLEVHDIVCKIADIVVVGGVRRAALLSLSNLTDERMRTAKFDIYYVDENGNYQSSAPQRALANNSTCYTEKPDLSAFLNEWRGLYESKSGERGIFNRQAAKLIASRNGRRNPEFSFGTNPCSEIILRSKQFCNLTEVVVRNEDDLSSLKRKVRIATILGTLQATLTDFRYLSPEWKNNCEEERLLGVSLTGIMDHPVLSSSTREDLGEILEELKEEAIETNNVWADRLGIARSGAITCVKPSGTVSQLVNSSSGIHPRYSDYYIRTVRTDKKDPVYSFLKDQGVPCEDAIGKEESTAIFSFPVKSPERAITRNQFSALDQLNLWKIYSDNWCEHKPSITVYVRDNEWLEVGAWVYRNFDIVSGISFLPHTDHLYPQAPYQEITEEQYRQALVDFPDEIDWGRLRDYEDGNNTSVEHELSCSAGGCEII